MILIKENFIKNNDFEVFIRKKKKKKKNVPSGVRYQQGKIHSPGKSRFFADVHKEKPLRNFPTEKY